MRIDGITTCVGEEYAGYLAKALPVWIDTLDSLTVVMDFGASTWRANCGYSLHRKLVAIETDAFTRHKASFNKGAALNEGIAAAKPTDWILAFDCDILPPSDWHEQAERFARRACLNSVQRFKPDGTAEDRRFYPRGFFQLWHSSAQPLPPFEECHKHAGRYDTAFAELWPQEYWNDLRFRVTHLGVKAKRWFGPGTTTQQMDGARREAKKLRTVL